MLLVSIQAVGRVGQEHLGRIEEANRVEESDYGGSGNSSVHPKAAARRCVHPPMLSHNSDRLATSLVPFSMGNNLRCKGLFFFILCAAEIFSHPRKRVQHP